MRKIIHKKITFETKQSFFPSVGEMIGVKLNNKRKYDDKIIREE
jgi:hypothetical protein